MPLNYGFCANPVKPRISKVMRLCLRQMDDCRLLSRNQKSRVVHRPAAGADVTATFRLRFGCSVLRFRLRSSGAVQVARDERHNERDLKVAAITRRQSGPPPDGGVGKD